MGSELTGALEAAGVAFIFLAGSGLHFFYDWTGRRRWIAWFAPVNESTWEHFKLAFWPGLVYALLEYGMIGGEVGNFWAGKALGLLVMPLVIAGIFYAYKAVLGRHRLVLDILLFLVAVAAGQGVSYRVLTAEPLGGAGEWWGVAGVVLMAAAYCLFTYHPPHLFLFSDPRMNSCGVGQGQ